LSSEEKRFEEVASAIEDLLYMGAIRFDADRALLSPQFSFVTSNVLDSMKINVGEPAEVMKLMYYSFLIYMNEHLKVPKSLTIAFGNDMENHRDSMESGQLVTTYVAILSEIWSQNNNNQTERKSQ
jgi:hypothetical protein